MSDQKISCESSKKDIKIRHFMQHLVKLKRAKVKVFKPSEVAFELSWMTTMEVSQYLRHVKGIRKSTTREYLSGVSRTKGVYEFIPGTPLEYEQ